MSSLSAVNYKSHTQEVLSKDSSDLNGRINNSSLIAKIRRASKCAFMFLLLTFASSIPTADAGSILFAVCMVPCLRALVPIQGARLGFAQCYVQCLPSLAEFP